MEKTKVKTFSEIYCLLNLFPKSYIDKLPKKLLTLIEQNSDSKYFIEVDITKSLEEQNISEETKNTLVVFKYNYWADEKEKKKILEQLKRNENKYNEEVKEKYNLNNFFKDQKTTVETIEKSVKIVEYKESFFTRIKKWFKRNILTNNI